MCRHKSNALCAIEALCASQDLNVSDLAKKSKLLLTVYRTICWATFGSCQSDSKDYFRSSDNEIDRTLEYLQSYSPELTKFEFGTALKAVADAEWIVDLVEQAMIRVKEYPEYGELYFSLLSTIYLDRFKYSEQDLLDMFKIERSCYFDRKKEAILVFGWALWGHIIPKTLEQLQHTQASIRVPILGTVSA